MSYYSKFVARGSKIEDEMKNSARKRKFQDGDFYDEDDYDFSRKVKYVDIVNILALAFK